MKDKKPTESQLASLLYLYRLGGAVMTGDWVRSDYYRQLEDAGLRRALEIAVPIFSARIQWCDVPGARIWEAHDRAGNLVWHDPMPKRIRRVFDANPHCESVIAITKMRSAKRALREAGMLPAMPDCAARPKNAIGHCGCARPLSSR